MTPLATTLFIVLLVIVGLAILIGLGLFAYTAWTAYRVEKSMPARGQFIEIDGARLHYIEAGSGTPILLIHGLGGQLLNFRHALFGKLTDRHRVVAIDRPGSGYSARTAKADASITAQANTIATAIDALKLDRPLVVGHSLGGAIALALALDHPDKVSGLALLAPLTTTSDEVPELFRGLVIKTNLMRRVVSWTMAIPLSIRNSQQTLDVVFGPDAVPDDFGTRGGGLLSLRPESFITASRDLVAVPEALPGYSCRYEAITCPIGIIFGTGDKVVDYRANGAAMVMRLPHLIFKTIDNAGHMIPVTHAERVAAFIETMAEKAGPLRKTAIHETGPQAQGDAG